MKSRKVLLGLRQGVGRGQENESYYYHVIGDTGATIGIYSSIPYRKPLSLCRVQGRRVYAKLLYVFFCGRLRAVDSM